MLVSTVLDVLSVVNLEVDLAVMCTDNVSVFSATVLTMA